MIIVDGRGEDKRWSVASWADFVSSLRLSVVVPGVANVIVLDNFFCSEVVLHSLHSQFFCSVRSLGRVSSRGFLALALLSGRDLASRQHKNR